MAVRYRTVAGSGIMDDRGERSAARVAKVKRATWYGAVSSDSGERPAVHYTTQSATAAASSMTRYGMCEELNACAFCKWRCYAE